jgi:membrane protease YdiL (CAAX protease family)
MIMPDSLPPSDRPTGDTLVPGEERSKRSFTPRLGTYILLVFLVIIWPGLSLLLLIVGGGDLSLDMVDPVRFIYIPTIIIEWLIVLAVALGVRREKSSFASIGLVRPKIVDLRNAILFLIGATIALKPLEMGLTAVGLPVNQNVDVLVQHAGQAFWWWLAISATAGFCEEVAFRGYIVTRVRGIFPKGGWVLALVVSSFAFAAGHGYQGVGGLILLFFLGAMFCGLFLYAKSLWPAILAHFIQDFSTYFYSRFIGS